MVFDSEPNPQLPMISGARVEALSEVAQTGHSALSRLSSFTCSREAC
jgi:hypothetical protein